jgi:hypothetical protein
MRVLGVWVFALLANCRCKASLLARLHAPTPITNTQLDSETVLNFFNR